MTRRISSICYKMFVCLSLMLGIFFNLNQTTSRKALLSYYTLQSNIICLIAFLIFLVFEIIKKQYKNDMYYLLKGALVVAIAKRAREIAAEAELKGEILVEKPVDLAVNEYIEGAFRIVEPKECSGKQDLEYMEANEAMEDDMSVNAEAFPSGHVTL